MKERSKPVHPVTAYSSIHPKPRSMAPRTRTATSTACRYQQFSAVLSSAVLEWVLMLLMLLEGLLSCLATSFARLCKLPPPCPMCARLGDARYRDLICSSHKAEASSCRVHQNLADVHGMCEVCRDVSRDRCDDEAVDHVGYSVLKTSDSESELLQRAGEFTRSSEHAGIIDSLKEDFALIHGQIEAAYGNAEEKIASYSELTRVQDRVSDEKIRPEDPKERHNIKANVQSNDHHRTDGQEISEETHTDKPEDDVWHNAISSTEESPGTTDNGRSSETKAASDEPKPEVSDRTTTRQDSFVVHQDLKLLLSQLSTSSRTPDPSAELQHEQAILRNISRVLSLERNYSGVSDGSMLDTEPEAECNTVDALRRQVELDRRSMALLWKELEEERSASAVAASQAMAMITRLQEEKAATRTEAAQYRRVMEEQSAYDREDAEMLAGEVRDLEAEVERCMAELRDQAIAGEIRDQMRLLPQPPREGRGVPGSSAGGFGDEENAYISKQLRKLTEKLHRFSNNSSRVIQEPEPTDDEQENGGEQEEDRAEASEVGRRVRNADNFTKWQQLQSIEMTNGRGGGDGGESDNMAGLQDEISELRGRLQALEADRSFLEHSVNSLRNGREGEAVIDDIARSLRELRKTLGNDAYGR